MINQNVQKRVFSRDKSDCTVDPRRITENSDPCILTQQQFFTKTNNYKDMSLTISREGFEMSMSILHCYLCRKNSETDMKTSNPRFFLSMLYTV